MAQPYIGEVRMFAGNFPPVGWMFCDGQLVSITENEALFYLLGTRYGGDGQETFALPDLRGRVPIHMGNGPSGITYPLSQRAGVERVTLTTAQIPSHTHALLASGAPGSTPNPGNAVLAESVADRIYGTDVTSSLHASSIAPVGGSQPHDNMQPYLCVSFIISLFGLFPQPY